MPNLLKTFQECQHHEDTEFLFVMEKFCDFFTFRPSDILMDNFCPCLLFIGQLSSVDLLSPKKILL